MVSVLHACCSRGRGDGDEDEGGATGPPRERRSDRHRVRGAAAGQAGGGGAVPLASTGAGPQPHPAPEACPAARRRPESGAPRLLPAAAEDERRTGSDGPGEGQFENAGDLAD